MDLSTAAAAMAGAVVTSVIFHPLDTILTLRQTSVSDCLVLPFRHYWRGVTATAVLTTPTFALFLVSYRESKKALTPYLGSDSAIVYMLSGTVAEFSSSVIGTPMEVIKGRLQLKQGNQWESTTKLMRSIYAAEGIHGFFRGYLMKSVIYTPNTICYWYVYEHLKSYYKSKMNTLAGSKRSTPSNNDHSAHMNVEQKTKLSLTQYALASSVATVCAESISNFLDVVKTRQQLASSQEIKALRPEDRKSLWTVARNLIREVGIPRALVKGLHIRLLYALPATVLSMTIFEALSPEDATECDF
ncbi:mitochondrial carrier domain-containing protein [Dipodascopsis uninucleata]